MRSGFIPSIAAKYKCCPSARSEASTTSRFGTRREWPLPAVRSTATTSSCTSSPIEPTPSLSSPTERACSDWETSDLRPRSRSWRARRCLFKYLGGVDAVPICLATTEPGCDRPHRQIPAAIIRGHQPRGHRATEMLSDPRSAAKQHRDPRVARRPTRYGDSCSWPHSRTRSSSWASVSQDCKVAMVGMGAANVATYRLLKARGLDPSRGRCLRLSRHAPLPPTRYRG